MSIVDLNEHIISQRVVPRSPWIARNFDANGSPCDEEAAVPVMIIESVLAKPLKYISIKVDF